MTHPDIKGSLPQVDQEKLQRLTDAMNTFNMITAGDADLVRPGAEHHGVEVIERGVEGPLSYGDYNRLSCQNPSQDAARAARAETVVLICEDYRQSGQYTQERFHGRSRGTLARGTQVEVPQNALIITSAGGPAEFDSTRYAAHRDLLAAIFAANPSVNFELVTHTGVCGGIAHQTGRENARILEQKGALAEHEYMDNFVIKLIKDLQRSGVPNSKMKGLVAVVENDQYKGVKPVKV